MPRQTGLRIALFSAAVLFAAGAAADQPPQVDKSAGNAVIYPRAAQIAGEQGTVSINVFISASGKPRKYQVVQSSGFSDLDTAAIQTVANWKYLPAQRNGSTTSDWVQVQVVYKLPETTDAGH